MQPSEPQPSILQSSSISQNVSHQSQSSQNKSQTSNQGIKCVNNNRATYFCFNRRCDSKTPFSCSREQCECNNGHYLCSRVRINEVLKEIKQKILKTQNIKMEIERIVDQAISALQELKEKFTTQVQTRIKYSQLSKVEKKFLSVCEDKQAYSDFGGKMLYELWGTITAKSSQKQRINTEAIKHLQVIKEQTQSTIQKTVDSVKSLLSTYQIDHDKQETRRLQMLRIQKLRHRTESVENQILAHKLTVLNSLEFAHRLVRFFPLKLKSIKQVFQASVHDFCMNKFYEICGHLHSIVIVCRTNGGQVIGAYSRLPFNPTKPKSGEYINDDTGTSFIFSISNNDVFHLVNKSGAIYRYASKDKIRFGSDEFTLGDRANIAHNCYTSLNSYYNNANYVDGDVNSYMRMNGNSSDQFTTKEWEAWKVEFGSGDEEI